LHSGDDCTAAMRPPSTSKLENDYPALGAVFLIGRFRRRRVDVDGQLDARPFRFAARLLGLLTPTNLLDDKRR
jgi:hypothetical protein